MALKDFRGPIVVTERASVKTPYNFVISDGGKLWIGWGHVILWVCLIILGTRL